MRKKENTISDRIKKVEDEFNIILDLLVKTSIVLKEAGEKMTETVDNTNATNKNLLTVKKTQQELITQIYRVNKEVIEINDDFFSYGKKIKIYGILLIVIGCITILNFSSVILLIILLLSV